MSILANKVETRAQAERARSRGEAFLRLLNLSDFQQTLGELLGELLEEPSIIDLDVTPFEKLSETAWNIQGQKLMVHRICSILEQWKKDAGLDVGSFLE